MFLMVWSFFLTWAKICLSLTSIYICLVKSREGSLIPFPYLRAACFHPSPDKHLLISLRLSCLVRRMWPFWKSSLCLCVPSWMPDAEEKMLSLPPRNSLGKRFNWCSGKVKMPRYKSVPSELALPRPLEKIKLIKTSKLNLMHWKGLLISVFGMMMSSSQRCINSWPALFVFLRPVNPQTFSVSGSEWHLWVPHSEWVLISDGACRRVEAYQ